MASCLNHLVSCSLLTLLPKAQSQGRGAHHRTVPFSTERLILLELMDQHQAQVTAEAGVVSLYHLHLLQFLSSVDKHAIMSIFTHDNPTCLSEQDYIPLSKMCCYMPMTFLAGC